MGNQWVFEEEVNESKFTGFQKNCKVITFTA